MVLIADNVTDINNQSTKIFLFYKYNENNTALVSMLLILYIISLKCIDSF